MAITWRTLNQPTTAGVGFLLNGAQQGMVSGIQALQNVLAQHNKTESANWDTTKDNNTADYQDAVQAISDPNQANNPETQAKLASLKEQFGYQVDRNVVRTAMDDRVANLQKQGLASIDYNDKTRIDGERDQVDQIASLYQAGKYAEGDALRQGKNFRDDAVLDKMKVDAQRGYSTEQRAVNGDKRAGLASADNHNSSVLNQKIGQENLNFSTKQHATTLEAQDRLQAGNDILSGAVNGWQATQDQLTERTNQVAQDAGFKVVNNVPILDGATDEQKADLAAKLKAAGLDSAPSSTAVLTAFDKRLRNDPKHHYSETEISTLKGQLDKGINGLGSLSLQDQADLDAKNASLTAASDARLAKEKSNWDKSSRSNKFLNGMDDPSISMTDIGTALKDFGPWTMMDSSNKEKFIKLATQYNTDGITVDGTKYNVPPPMIKAAMAMSADDWADPGNGLTQSLEAMIKSDPQAYAESLDLYTKHMDAVNNEKADTLRASASYKAQALGKAGVSPSVNKLLQALKGAKQ